MRPIIAAAAAALLWTGTASAAQPVLRQGSHGAKVAGLQWMLAGHRPNVFRGVATYHHKPNGLFGNRTAAAVVAYKWRLGYPKKLVRPIAGPYLFALLTGRSHRPPAWIATAAKRLKAVVPGFTPLALKIKNLEVSQLGVVEQPLGSNLGVQVIRYQQATGAVGLAWCVSFQQWGFLHGGYGTFADRTAGVYAAVDWAVNHGYLRAKPKLGALVAFIDYDSGGRRIPGTGHMGYVVKITAHGFASVEGNQANGVHEVYHQIGERPAAFIYLPRVA